MSPIPQFPDDLPTASVPRISLFKLEQSDKTEEARLFKACISFGCFLLDLSDTADGARFLSEVDQASSIGKAFFDAPMDEKLEFKMDSKNLGYKAPGTFNLAGGKDEVEIYGVGKDRILDPSNRETATQFLEHRSLLSALITERLHPVGLLILRLIAANLEMDVSTLRDLHSDTAPSGTVIRYLHYPGAASDPGPDEGDARLVGHTDNGSLTILFTKLGGLQVLPPSAEEHDSLAWEWVRPEPGCAFINIGDSMVQWTGGVLRSVYHRVVRPPGEQSKLDRYSFGYFLKPTDEAPMKRLREGLIPDASGEEEQEVSYRSWHQQKTKNITSGVNGMSRGGNVPITWKNQHLVEACS